MELNSSGVITNAQVRVCVIRCVARAYIASKRARVVNDCHGARAGKRKREAVCDATPPRKKAYNLCRLLETQRRESQSVTASRPPKMALGHFSTEARMIVASMVRSLLRR